MEVEEETFGVKPKKSPKNLLKLILVLILGVVFGAIVVFHHEIRQGLKTFLPFLQKKKTTNNQLVQGEKKEKEEFKFDFKLWEDPAGFSFEYPKDLEIDIHPEDGTNYSFLTLSHKEKEGKIDIKCNDSPYSTLEEWLEKDELVKNGSAVETKIASLSAQKIALADNREVAALIDNDKVIYIFDKNPAKEKNFWQAVFNHLLQSFKLIPLQGESQEEFNQWLNDFETSNVDIIEEVEVIE